MEKRKLKIAFLSFYSGEVYRGVETFVHETANRLTHMGHAVTVYQNGSELLDAKYKTESLGLNINWSTKKHVVPFINYWGKKVGFFTLKVLKKLDKDTDIVFPTNGQWSSLLCRIWTKINKSHLVISGHSGLGLDDRINIWTFPDVFLGFTKRQVSWAKRVNPLVKVKKISNGVDTSKFGVNIKPMKIKLQKPIILCVAAFDSWKRPDLTVKAVSRLKKGSLLLVGKGDLEEKLKTMGEEMLPGRFATMSFPHRDMPKVYSAADLFTYPANPGESFGLVLLEAMASGLGIVATRDPIRKEIVGEAGLLVDPTDTAQYAKALKRALNTNWGEKPRKQAKKHDWDIIAKKYEELFLKLAVNH